MKKAFTLIELLVVICILGVLSSLIVGNFLTSLKKGRDAQRKADVEAIIRANELYYSDTGSYVNGAMGVYGDNYNQKYQFCTQAVNGCSTKIYMKKVPRDPLYKDANGEACEYNVDPDPSGTGFLIYTPLENDQDNGPGVSQAGWQNDGHSCCSGRLCKYSAGSSNAAPVSN